MLMFLCYSNKSGVQRCAIARIEDTFTLELIWSIVCQIHRCCLLMFNKGFVQQVYTNELRP